MKRSAFTSAIVGSIVFGLYTAPQAQAPSATGVTFSKDVAPILQKACQNCHRPGSIAPMALLS